MQNKNIIPPNYSCHLCEKKFYERQEIYMIRNVVLDFLSAENGFSLHWRWIKEKDDMEMVYFYFHRECFRKIGAEEYMAKIRGNNKNELL